MQKFSRWYSLAVVVVLTLLLSACVVSTAEDGSVQGRSGVKSDGDGAVFLPFLSNFKWLEPAKPGNIPELSVKSDGSMEVLLPEGDLPSKSSSKVLTAGNGPAAVDGSEVVIHWEMFSWSRGEVVESTRAMSEIPVAIALGDLYIPDTLQEAVIGANPGSRLMVVFEKGMADLPAYLDPNDAYVLVVDVEGVDGDFVGSSSELSAAWGCSWWQIFFGGCSTHSTNSTHSTTSSHNGYSSHPTPLPVPTKITKPKPIIPTVPPPPTVVWSPTPLPPPTVVWSPTSLPSPTPLPSPPVTCTNPPQTFMNLNRHGGSMEYFLFLSYSEIGLPHVIYDYQNVQVDYSQVWDYMESLGYRESGYPTYTQPSASGIYMTMYWTGGQFDTNFNAYVFQNQVDALWDSMPNWSVTYNGETINLCKGRISTHSPIALDIDGSNSVERIDGEFSLDLTGNGEAETVSEWFAPTEGILIDTNIAIKNGEITGQHLFGDMGSTYADGFEKLALLDANADGQVAGAELNGLAIWTDANSNAKLDAGEMSSLASHSVVSLSTNHIGFVSAATLADGSSMMMEDLWFPAVMVASNAGNAAPVSAPVTLPIAASIAAMLALGATAAVWNRREEVASVSSEL